MCRLSRCQYDNFSLLECQWSVRYLCVPRASMVGLKISGTRWRMYIIADGHAVVPLQGDLAFLLHSGSIRSVMRTPRYALIWYTRVTTISPSLPMEIVMPAWYEMPLHTTRSSTRVPLPTLPAPSPVPPLPILSSWTSDMFRSFWSRGSTMLVSGWPRISSRGSCIRWQKLSQTKLDVWMRTTRWEDGKKKQGRGGRDVNNGYGWHTRCPIIPYPGSSLSQVGGEEGRRVISQYHFLNTSSSSDWKNVYVV